MRNFDLRELLLFIVLIGVLSASRNIQIFSNESYKLDLENGEKATNLLNSFKICFSSNHIPTKAIRNLRIIEFIKKLENLIGVQFKPKC